MPRCLLIADRQMERMVNRQSLARVTVGRQEGIRGIVGREAVTLYIDELAGNQLHYPAGRIYLSPEQAHELSEQLETMAKAIKFGYTPKSKDT